MTDKPYPPACVDCKYYKEGAFHHWCTRMSEVKEFSPVTGFYKKRESLSCADERHGIHEEECGYEGKFFIPKPTLLSRLKGLFR